MSNKFIEVPAVAAGAIIAIIAVAAQQDIFISAVIGGIAGIIVIPFMRGFLKGIFK